MGRRMRRSSVLGGALGLALAGSLVAAEAASGPATINSEAASFQLTTPSKDTDVKQCTKSPNLLKVDGKVSGPIMAEMSTDPGGTTDPRLSGTALLEYHIIYDTSNQNGVMDGHLHVFAGPAPSGPETATGDVHATLVNDPTTEPDPEFMDGFMLLDLHKQGTGATALPDGDLYANFSSTVTTPALGSSNAPASGLTVPSGKLGDDNTPGPTAGRNFGPGGSWMNHNQNNAAMFLPEGAC